MAGITLPFSFTGLLIALFEELVDLGLGIIVVNMAILAGMLFSCQAMMLADDSKPESAPPAGE
jgi:L-cystine uptake protein TcyP (sodium:dicarboxylate symporter family)